MKGQKTKHTYEFQFWPAAEDLVGINHKLSDHVEIKYDEHEMNPGPLLIRATAEGESPNDGLQRAFIYLGEVFDFHCVLKGAPVNVQGYDQIDILKPESKRPPHLDYGGIPNFPFSITKKEGKRMYAFITKFRTGKYRFLSLAMKYYRNAKLHKQITDKLINYFISLESLFTDNNTEITFRFSRRLGLLLGNTAKERKKIANLGRIMYRQRSNVAHGQEPKVSEKEMDMIDKWVRQSILAFIALMKYYKTRENILKKLDDGMLDDKIRESLHKKKTKLFHS